MPFSEIPQTQVSIRWARQQIDAAYAKGARRGSRISLAIGIALGAILQLLISLAMDALK